jgi:hypothetical protein
VTCIIGVEFNGRVFMGGDAAGSDGYGNRPPIAAEGTQEPGLRHGLHVAVPDGSVAAVRLQAGTSLRVDKQASALSTCRRTRSNGN